jgi:hypothetical protein
MSGLTLTWEKRQLLRCYLGAVARCNRGQLPAGLAGRALALARHWTGELATGRRFTTAACPLRFATSTLTLLPSGLGRGWKRQTSLAQVTLPLQIPTGTIRTAWGGDGRAQALGLPLRGAGQVPQRHQSAAYDEDEFCLRCRAGSFTHASGRRFRPRSGDYVGLSRGLLLFPFHFTRSLMQIVLQLDRPSGGQYRSSGELAFARAVPQDVTTFLPREPPGS